jgi:hypothetical protein
LEENQTKANNSEHGNLEAISKGRRIWLVKGQKNNSREGLASELKWERYEERKKRGRERERTVK